MVCEAMAVTILKVKQAQDHTSKCKHGIIKSLTLPSLEEQQTKHDVTGSYRVVKTKSR